jgi:spermidine synthase
MTTRSAAIVVGIVGFVSLSYEIIWFRVYSYITGGSPVTFGLLLGIYLAGLAVGADVAGKICHGVARSERGRARKTVLRFAFVANVTAFLVVPLMAYSTSQPSRRWIALIAVFVSASFSGALLPFVSHLSIDDRNAGRGVSYVYSANIVGSVLGTVLTGFVLTDLMTTQQTAVFLSIVGLCPVALIAVATDRAGFTRTAGLLIASAAAFVISAPKMFDRLYEKLQFKEVYHGQRFAQVVENRHGIVAVTDSGATFGGGVYDGHVTTGLVVNNNGIERAYAISAMHPHPRKVLMIGMATGAWGQVIANSTLVDSLTIVEINPGYLELIKNYPSVAPLLTNPKVKIVIDDGRRWLVHHPDRRFDFIVSNTTFHYRANSTNLLSIEFMRLIHSHLEPGGMFTFNTTGSQDAFRTAFEEFPRGVRISNYVTVSDSVVKLDSARWRNLLATYEIDGKPVFDMRVPRDRTRFEEVAALSQTIRGAPTPRGLESRESVLRRIPASAVITDDNMLPEWRTLILHSSSAERVATKGIH